MIKGVDFVGVSVVYFCHDGKGNFVMGKRSQNARDEHGKWDIGAGGVEVKDSVDETLRKEIMEEYCTEVIEAEFLGFRDIFREHNGQKTHWIGLDYKVLINPQTVKNGEPHKMDEVKWFTKETMPPDLEMHSQWPVFLAKYKTKIWS
jgi:8-oxo-dGTP pyrophosphatase MutT (NUDIX family)